MGVVKYTRILDNGFIVSLTSDLESEKLPTENHMNERLMIFKEVKVPVSLWMEDSTYAEYPYRADIKCVGVTDKYAPAVILNKNQYKSGIYSEICESRKDAVRIYARKLPERGMKIPTIMCILPE